MKRQCTSSGCHSNNISSCGFIFPNQYNFTFNMSESIAFNHWKHNTALHYLQYILHFLNNYWQNQKIQHCINWYYFYIFVFLFHISCYQHVPPYDRQLPQITHDMIFETLSCTKNAHRNLRMRTKKTRRPQPPCFAIITEI